MTARQSLDRVGVQQAEVAGDARTVTAVGSLCVILTLHLSLTFYSKSLGLLRKLEDL